MKNEVNAGARAFLAARRPPLHQSLMRIRIKACGLTREQDIAAAVAAGVDAIGMVFYAPSARSLTIDKAAALRAQIPAFVSLVALFVNPEPALVNEVIERLGPDLLQFHGDEPASFCHRFGRRYIKAFRVGAPGQDSPEALLQSCQAYPDASAWLFDSYSAAYGGSGQGFDLALLAAVNRLDQRPAMVLAGGLDSGNVGNRIRACKPFAVDVSSGIEQSPGIKDAQRLQAFVQAVRAAGEQP